MYIYIYIYVYIYPRKYTPSASFSKYAFSNQDKIGNSVKICIQLVYIGDLVISCCWGLHTSHLSILDHILCMIKVYVFSHLLKLMFTWSEVFWIRSSFSVHKPQHYGTLSPYLFLSLILHGSLTVFIVKAVFTVVRVF